MANTPLIATTPPPGTIPSAIGATQNPTSFTSATDPGQTLALPQTPSPAPVAAPAPAAMIPLPTELQGMPITPGPQVGLSNQQPQQNQTQEPQANQVPQAPNQTMMLAAQKKAAEDRRLAQIAAYNQRR